METVVQKTNYTKINCIKTLINSINKFTLKEKFHILKILKNNNIDYSRNSYGYFFNLNNLEDDIFYKLSKCIELIECNRDIIKQMDKKRDDLINYYTHLIETNLNKTKREKLENYINSLILNDIQTEIQIRIKKKHVKKENEVDPDILMKEYIKRLNKYPKNSVYHRILTRIKTSKTKYIEIEKDDYEDDISDGGGEIEIDNDIEQENDLEAGPDNDPDLEPVIDLEIDIENEIDPDIEIDPGFDNEIGIDADLENEPEISIKNNKISEKNTFLGDDEHKEEFDEEDNEELNEENEKKDQEEYQHNLNFYRKLLNKQGFIFNENMKCLLEYQSYIE